MGLLVILLALVMLPLIYIIAAIGLIDIAFSLVTKSITQKKLASYIFWLLMIIAFLTAKSATQPDSGGNLDWVTQLIGIALLGVVYVIIRFKKACKNS